MLHGDRWGRLLAILILLMVPTSAGAQRAVVFDGSFAAADTFAADLGNPWAASLGNGGFGCSGVNYASPGGTSTPAPLSPAVQPGDLPAGTPLRDYIAGRPPLPPLPIDSLEDDCDVVAVFPQVEAYVAQVLSDGASRIAALGVCRSQFEQAYCSFAAAVEIAFEESSCGVCVLASGELSGSPGRTCTDFPGAWGRCVEIRTTIARDLPALLDDLDREIASCEALRDEMQAAVGLVPASMRASEKQGLLEWASRRFADIEDIEECAADVHADLIDMVNGVDLASAQDSCDQCAGWSGGGIYRWLASPTADVAPDASVLFGVASLFAATASTVSDVDLAARYTQISQSMAAIPAERVLRVELPTHALGETIAVGLRDANLPDDGISPLAVVIRSLPVPVSQPIGALDRRVAGDAWRALSRAVDPAATLPGATDDDSDGVRDAFETATGSFASNTNVGTSSDLVDSDGDLYTDGTELFAGTDPNDPASNPPAVLAALAALPALAPPALGLLLGVLAVGGILHAARQKKR